MKNGDQRDKGGSPKTKLPTVTSGVCCQFHFPPIVTLSRTSLGFLRLLPKVFFPKFLLFFLLFFPPCRCVLALCSFFLIANSLLLSLHVPKTVLSQQACSPVLRCVRRLRLCTLYSEVLIPAPRGIRWVLRTRKLRSPLP